MPIRVQRKRSRDWRMPADTVYVGRPTKWGNPFAVGSPGVSSASEAVELYRDWIKAELNANPRFLDPLLGKNLACWCPLDKPCHVDVLLELLSERPEQFETRQARSW